MKLPPHPNGILGEVEQEVDRALRDRLHLLGPLLLEGAEETVVASKGEAEHVDVVDVLLGSGDVRLEDSNGRKRRQSV